MRDGGRHDHRRLLRHHTRAPGGDGRVGHPRSADGGAGLGGLTRSRVRVRVARITSMNDRRLTIGTLLVSLVAALVVVFVMDGGHFGRAGGQATGGAATPSTSDLADAGSADRLGGRAADRWRAGCGVAARERVAPGDCAASGRSRHPTPARNHRRRCARRRPTRTSHPRARRRRRWRRQARHPRLSRHRRRHRDRRRPQRPRHGRRRSRGRRRPRHQPQLRQSRPRRDRRRPRCRRSHRTRRCQPPCQRRPRRPLGSACRSSAASDGSRALDDGPDFTGPGIGVP